MIERRRMVVTLYQGDDTAHLSELRAEIKRVSDMEARMPRRMSSKSPLTALAAEHDEFQDAMEERAVKVTVWALTNDQFEQLSELHPPRDDDKRDAGSLVNTTTMPGALLRASLLAPDESPADVTKAVEKGGVKLAALGDLSRVQLRKLEDGAVSVNVEDDALGKFSIVSFLRQARADENEQQPATE